ncbi:purple acid phosphatase family protein [Microbacterium mangrovi]|uniref:purple acid phosphatase family protein n=1 Tax=Microbacterium mangrovi TaxID=1348253 RepID=UPI00068D81B0|nr:metallophosphoesterase family protein [Microbacterium mangrovi]
MKKKQSRGRLAASVGVIALGAGVATGGVFAAQAAVAADAPVDIKTIVLGVGADERSHYVTWYADKDTASVVQLEKTAQLDHGAFDKHAVSFPAEIIATTGTSGGDVARSPYRGSALLSGFSANTSYSYRVLAKDGSASPTYTFKTSSFGVGKGFTFGAFGDPQIGADSNSNSLSTSSDLQEDAAGWTATLNALQADAANDGLPLELLTSTGDQIETANVESQWDAWFQPDQLRTIPYAAAIGNHDSSDLGYKYHFALPNSDVTTSDLQTAAGGDYWYTYKGVLFVVINSNAQSSVKNPAHMDFVRKAVEANPSAQWKVVSYHHAIYSPASHANDSDNVARRPDFTKAFSDLGINLVLQGHDHSYSRSYVLRNSGDGAARQDAAEQQAQDSVFEGPGGVVYVTTNSASGSKYYSLTEPIAGTSDATHNGLYDLQFMPWGPAKANATNGTPAGTHALHWANSVENQDNVRTYLKVEVTSQSLKVSNVVAGVCDYPNKYTTQGYGTWCGAAQAGGKLVDTNGDGVFTRNQPSRGAAGTPSNADADRFVTTQGVAPVGSIQDSVTITRDNSTK